LQDVDRRNNEDRHFEEIFERTKDEINDLLGKAIDFEEDEDG